MAIPYSLALYLYHENDITSNINENQPTREPHTFDILHDFDTIVIHHNILLQHGHCLYKLVDPIYYLVLVTFYYSSC